MTEHRTPDVDQPPCSLGVAVRPHGDLQLWQIREVEIIMKTVNPTNVAQRQAASALSHLRAQFPEGGDVVEALERLSAGLRAGTAMSLAGDEEHVSPNAAAELIGMSRTHLLTFIKAGALKAEYVGTHRRIKMSDLRDFEARRAAGGKTLAEARASAPTAAERYAEVAVPLSDEALSELDELFADGR